MHLSLIQQPAITRTRTPVCHVVGLLGLWVIIFFVALFSPPLLDDADATHAQAARTMATTGDWVTLHVNGIRYLEKPPLPYWLVAISFRIFGFNTFSVHLPLALAVLALAALGYRWASEAFDERTGFYTALATLTCTGVFLFTRVFIPEVLLSLFLCLALYVFLKALEPDSHRANPYIMWASLALAVLTKGLIAPVFFLGTAILFLLLTGQTREWRRLRPFSGIALFFLIAAPWHILASLRNTGGANGHGFFWFYFINEHVLRFLGRRIPRDYNKLPFALYWSLHLVWLFPWSLFSPLAIIFAWRRRHILIQTLANRLKRMSFISTNYGLERGRAFASEEAAGRTTLILSIYSALVLLFFSFSTNQEYYTFPVYLPLLVLICAAIVRTEHSFDRDRTLRRTILAGHIAYTAIGLAAAAALAVGLWSARGLPFVPDIGALLAHRGVGDYTLSMSHFFDLTGPSFAALRLPATLALIAFAFGPSTAWILRRRRLHFESTIAIAITSGVFLIAAHTALNRFAPMLSSEGFAEKIEDLASNNLLDRNTEILLFGDQSYGSSIPFYLDRQVELVDGRSSSMLFGSTFPDAPHIFLSSQDLVAGWGHGHRKILFVPEEKRTDVERLLGQNQIILDEASGKLLLTDRPLTTSEGLR